MAVFAVRLILHLSGGLLCLDCQNQKAIFTMVTFLNVVIGGLMLGGIYALIAVGLSLQYGVARVLNIAHGEFIMIGAFLTWWMYTVWGINPLVSLAIVGPSVFVIGFVLHRTLFKYIRTSSASPGAFEANSLLAAFGLLFIVQNLALIIWGADIEGYRFLVTSVNIGGALFPTNRMVTLGFAAGIALAFYIFLSRTRLGKAIRAAAQNPETAGLMGVNINRVLAICFGLGAMMAGLAGSLLSMTYTIRTSMGLEYTVIAIIVVVLGGMGSIVGSIIGGLLLGLVGSIMLHIDPSLSLVAYYFIFIILLLIKPTGILGK
ncbi:branched-chain amino acid ABC transporter permease [Chloroflexota bacterium]